MPDILEYTELQLKEQILLREVDITKLKFYLANYDEFHPIKAAQIEETFKRVFIKGLTETGKPNKLNCIKSLRDYCNLGLKDAKDVVDSVATGNWQEVNLKQDFTKLQLHNLETYFIFTI